MSRKYFGTDGVRGRVGVFPVTAEFALKLGNAAGQVLKAHDKSAKTIVLGQDTRVSGDMLKAAFVSGITATGIDVINLGIVPTPVVAFMVRALEASAGVVLSASHNPYYDNGVKLFSNEGEKLSDEIELEIEAALDKEFVSDVDGNYGQIISKINEISPYIEYCVSLFKEKIDLSDKKIIIDCAHGAMFRVAEEVFSKLKLQCVNIASNPDGKNINVGCGAVHLQMLKDRVIAEKAYLGIAFDGDGDRVMFVDELGNTVDGDDILYILSKHPSITQEVGGVVGTVMTNLAIEQAFDDAKIAFKRAKVGDRYVLEQLNLLGWKLGGEASGHVINLNYNTTGDGLLAALQLLAVLSQREQALSALSAVKKMPQVMINVPLSRKVDADDMSLLIEDVSFSEKALSDSGRVVLRPSGTEPVLRVMVEAKDKKLASKWAEYLVEKVKEKLVSV